MLLTKAHSAFEQNTTFLSYFYSYSSNEAAIIDGNGYLIDTAEFISDEP